MIWIIRLVALKTAAVATGVFVAVSIGASLFVAALPWSRSFEQGQQAAFSMSLIISVILAVGAAQTASTLLRSHGRADLLTAVRGRNATVLTILGCFALPVLAGLAAVAFVSYQVLGNGGEVALPWTTLRGLSSMLLAISLGAALGARLAPLYAIPMAAAGGFLPVAISLFGGSGIFLLDGPQYPLAGHIAEVGYALTGISTAVVAAVLLWPLASSRPTLRLLRIGAATTAAASVVIAGSVIPEEVPFTRLAEPRTCTDGVPAVCYYPGYQSLAETTRTSIDEMITAAVRAGLAADRLPTRLVLGGVPESLPERGTGRIFLGGVDLASGALSARAISDALATPAWCPQLRADDPPVGLLNQGSLVAIWLMHVNGDVDDSGFAADAESLSRLAPDRAAETVNEMLAAAGNCTVLPGVPTV